MRVAVLGLGEAGFKYSRAFAEAGHEVAGFDPRDLETAAGVVKAASVVEAVSGADLVLGLTTSRPSVSVAAEASASLAGDSVYIDMNAASPHRKREVQNALGADAKFVDGAVIGSVQRFGAQVHVLLSGAHSDEAAEKLKAIGAEAESIRGQVGDASRRKLLRSVFMKGLGALLTEAMRAGEETGEVEWMRTQIAGELVQGGETLDRLLSGTRTHAYRRSVELGDSVDLLSGLEHPWPMTVAARAVHLSLAADTEGPLADQLAAVPTSALGDAGDRLGFLNSSVKPMWKSPPLAGRAFTVQTRPGDNQAIHRALPLTAPGDVLVVAGGGYSERALIGELIAERAHIRGIAGMIIDGAIRDVKEIEEIGFPVWATGVSPAGPYKSGPGRLRETIAVAGAVCRHGDYVVADADGVLVVPAIAAEKILADGLAVVDDERRRQTEMRSEQSLSNN
ncbi:transferase [Brevibacterium sp. RIT803]|nr:transferase [Brevibacterium sp. RIT 803]